MLAFLDYESSSAQTAVIGGKVVQLDANAIGALAQNGMLLALGDPTYVAEMAAAAPEGEPTPAHGPAAILA